MPLFHDLAWQSGARAWIFRYVGLSQAPTMWEPTWIAPIKCCSRSERVADAGRSWKRRLPILGLRCGDDKMKFWHKHKWGEWERAWGKGSAKGYILERKCLICGRIETKVIR